MSPSIAEQTASLATHVAVLGEGRFINIDQPPITPPPPPPSSTPVTLPTDPKDEWNPPDDIAWCHSKKVNAVLFIEMNTMALFAG